jgi:hypothetical protein
MKLACELRTGRSAPAVVCIHDRVLVCGGVLRSQTTARTNSVEVLDLQKMECTESMPALPVTYRSTFACAMAKEWCIAFGWAENGSGFSCFALRPYDLRATNHVPLWLPLPFSGGAGPGDGLLPGSAVCCVDTDIWISGGELSASATNANNAAARFSKELTRWSVVFDLTTATPASIQVTRKSVMPDGWSGHAMVAVNEGFLAN